MNLLFESTEIFEKEIAKFQKKDKLLIIRKLNMYCDFLKNNDEKSFFLHAHKPKNILFAEQTDSTLYILRINTKIRIILTVDEDPLFEQIVITLFHIVSTQNIDKLYKKVSESLFQSKLHDYSIRGRK